MSPKKKKTQKQSRQALHESFFNLFISVQRCLYPLFQNQRPHFLHGPQLFLKSHFAKDVSLEICFYSILQSIQNLFDLGIPRISSAALKKFQTYGVKITGRGICKAEKLNLLAFAHSSKQPPRQKVIIHFARKAFSENLFPPTPAEKGED